MSHDDSAVTIEDFLARVEGVEPDDVPPDSRERIDDALADISPELYGSRDDVDPPNDPPRVSILAEPSAPSVGERVLFAAERSDPGAGSDTDTDTDTDTDEVVRYEWRVDGDVVDTGPSLSLVFQEAGTSGVTLTATDGEGASATARRQVVVAEEDPPVDVTVDANSIASGTDLAPADAKTALDAFVDTTTKALKRGNRVALGPSTQFGSFAVSKRSARKGRNPQTGKEIKIPAKKVVKFKPGAELSEKIK